MRMKTLSGDGVGPKLQPMPGNEQEKNPKKSPDSSTFLNFWAANQEPCFSGGRPDVFRFIRVRIGGAIFVSLLQAGAFTKELGVRIIFDGSWLPSKTKASVFFFVFFFPPFVQRLMDGFSARLEGLTVHVCL